MRINVAGAGAGKTTKMARLVSEEHPLPGQMIYCLAFTHAAVDNITEKVHEHFGTIPDYIWIGTIHSFLYQEIIDPFHALLYGKHFQKISVIRLPNEPEYKNKIISALKERDILHQTQIPEVAKWIVYKKSRDDTKVKTNRARILKHLKNYCYKIYVDEAQDIDQHMKEIFLALDKAGIQIELHGDPKQDVQGRGFFRELIKESDDLVYCRKCYRCPMIHLKLSNKLAQTEEQQEADSRNKPGSLEIVFETDTNDLQTLIDTFGLIYISKKNERFLTHSKCNNDRFDSVLHEIEVAMHKKWDRLRTEAEINRGAYYITERLTEADNVKAELNQWMNKSQMFDYPGNDIYARLMSTLNTEDAEANEGIQVNSIDSIKGLQDERCLFVLTTDLAPYLLGERIADNATKHLLYVALTRSLDNLTILVTSEVERKFGRDRIIKSIYQDIDGN